MTKSQKSGASLVSELWTLITGYVKQETIGALKPLGRYLAFGLAGALLIGWGIVFLTLGGLRALQTETGSTFDGNWSFVPYVIVIAVLLVLALGGLKIGTRRTGGR